jgi:hypothetical protein
MGPGEQIRPRFPPDNVIAGCEARRAMITTEVRAPDTVDIGMKQLEAHGALRERIKST